MDDKKVPKSSENYICINCNYFTSRKSQYDRHILTDKHKMITMDDKKVPKSSASHFCNCGKEYKHRQGLWKHKKICKIDESNSDNNNVINIEETNDKNKLIMMLIKQNSELIKETSEFKNMMMEVIKNGTHNTTNYTNSNNKAFNLNFFLNETCKDAMNIMEFIDSINLQLSDLEKVGELGYVDGISNIIVKNLKALDITQRPVHCTDKKRETLYIKDEDKWEKDSERTKMRKVIKRIANKNARLLPKFKEEHPDCGKSFSKFSDQYNKIIVESMGGPGNNDFEKEEKIIKKVTKEIIVGKEPL